MGPKIPENRSLLESRFYRATTILLAVAVTIDVCLAIVFHWRTYDWIKKFLALVLVSNLVIVPAAIIIKAKKGIATKPDMLVQTAYIWLLLATLLFNR
jgi:predicted neutral ceramidase superfamily lipid hydrolase